MTESFGSAQGFLASARTEAPSRVLELQVPGLSGLDRQKRMTEAGVETHRFPYGPRQYTSLSEGNESPSDRVPAQAIQRYSICCVSRHRSSNELSESKNAISVVIPRD